jgi:hypothetical protein
VIILDLCGGTGSWSAPYTEAGYDVRIIDIDSTEQDVKQWRDILASDLQVHGILAAPPCTCFANSGVRWWPDKDSSGATVEAIEIANACMDIIDHYKPVWWALENPLGRIRNLCPRVKRPYITFQPYEYGDPYFKTTCIYGVFNKPKKNFVWPTEGEKIHRMHPKTPDRAKLRSITPPNFARAFFTANP